MSAHVCSFEAVSVQVSKVGYDELKAAALKAGRFSVFEATVNQRMARLYTRLCRDPEIETFDMGYPWTGVRGREVAR